MWEKRIRVALKYEKEQSVKGSVGDQQIHLKTNKAQREKAN